MGKGSNKPKPAEDNMGAARGTIMTWTGEDPASTAVAQPCGSLGGQPGALHVRTSQTSKGRSHAEEQLCHSQPCSWRMGRAGAVPGSCAYAQCRKFCTVLARPSIPPSGWAPATVSRGVLARRVLHGKP